MKRPTTLSFGIALLLGVLGLALQSCLEDRCDQTYVYRKYTPIYMSDQEFMEAVGVESPRAMVNPGKIFVKDNLLFVNETGKGVHIFENSQPEQPVAISYLNVPGSYDLSIACDRLYLDSSTDLLVFDISEVKQPRFLHRVSNALPQIVEYRGFTADPSKGVVVGWTEEIVTGEFSCDGSIPMQVLINEVPPSEVDPGQMNNTRTINPATAGKAGSMSRFTVLNDHLYVVQPYDLRVFALNGCDYPSLVSEQSLSLPMGGEAEMITTINNYLLVGSTTGMAIYNAAEPSRPEFLSIFEHAQACDPVAAEGDFAYVTLRQENDQAGCGNTFTNQLDVVSIANMSHPTLVASFPMTNPHGVGIDQDLLFIADGIAGLRIFDAKDPNTVGREEIAHFEGMQGFDLIPFENILIMTGEDGVSQYDYSDPSEIRWMSTLRVEKE